MTKMISENDTKNKREEKNHGKFSQNTKQPLIKKLRKLLSERGEERNSDDEKRFRMKNKIQGRRRKDIKTRIP